MTARRCCHEPLLVHLRRSIKLIRNLNRMDGIRMNRRDSFEAAYAASHDLPIETFSQYRMGDTYRLPGIASHWRTWCAALDSVVIELPKKTDGPAISLEDDNFNWAIDECREAIEAAGLKVSN